MMSKTMCVVLASGIELIGQVDIDHNGVNIENPANIVMAPSQSTGQMSYGLVPWLPYGLNTKYTIPQNQVLVTFEPTLEMTNYYSRAFGSGIQLTQSTGIIK